jgi:uncharacterized protein (TIGR00288 family)
LTVARSRLAVLVDGDNVSPDAMDALFYLVDAKGDAVIRRVFGSQFGSKGWAKAAARHGLCGGRRHLHVSGHNASDIELVIDAMDVMATAAIDAFCLVSSDADFTPLAVRLREAGKIVYGFGDKAPAGFRAACHEWLAAKASKPTAMTAKVMAFPRPAIDVVAALRSAVETCENDDGWALMSVVGLELRKKIPGFSCRDHGASTLKKLALDAGVFDVATAQGKAVIRVARGDHARRKG